MNHRFAIGNILIVCAAFLLCAGCSDASAAEATYVPLHPDCEDTDGELVPTHTVSDFAAGLTTDSYGKPVVDDAESLRKLPAELSAPPQVAPALFPAQSTQLEYASVETTADDSAHQTGVDLNRADADELMSLPGIGPALAERILEYRDTRSFDDPAELRRIEGIGPATYDEIASRIYVE